jgi:DNA-binding transcriptional regulator YiaG
MMGTIDTAIKTEIVRLARREMRKLSAPLKDEVRRLKKRDAERKAHIVALEKQVRKLHARERLTETTAKVVTGDVKGRLSPRLIRSLRKKLGLSQNEFAKLLAVSAVSIGNWEAGRMNPRPDMRAKILSFRGMKRREVKLIVADLLKPAAARGAKGKGRRAKRAGKAKRAVRHRKVKVQRRRRAK